MSENNYNKLSQKIDDLIFRQIQFNKEINELKNELESLKNDSYKNINSEEDEQKINIEYEKIEITLNDTVEQSKANQFAQTYHYNRFADQKEPKTSPFKDNFEKFIGENLINKIGILILIIGVAIGTKYSIDNELINPLTRIILGYLVGIGLLGIGIKLKTKYEKFSSVIVSGACAILYFITYFAYSFYSLIPQLVAFILMLIFTMFTIAAALNYKREIIALIGLVGAYAVPLLLSDGSGKVTTFLSYVSILNLGVLIISIKQNWNNLFVSAFILTWLLFGSWILGSYDSSKHIITALVFSAIFYLQFYTIFIFNKIKNTEEFKQKEVFFLLVNSGLFYGIGYFILSSHKMGKEFLGVFTLINALFNMALAFTIKNKKNIDKNILFFVVALIFAFATLAIPVQLDGNWVTMLLAIEAAMLFSIARLKKVDILRKLSYPIMILSFISLLNDWQLLFDAYEIQGSINIHLPILNIYFLTSFVFILSFAVISKFLNSIKYDLKEAAEDSNAKLFSILIPSILVISIYGAFISEISLFWHQLYKSSIILVPKSEIQSAYNESNSDYIHFQSISFIIFTFLYLSSLLKINIIKFRNSFITNIISILTFTAICAFLTVGLYSLAELQSSYVSLDKYYAHSLMNVLIRYITYCLLFLLLKFNFDSIKLTLTEEKAVQWCKNFELVSFFTIVIISTAELFLLFKLLDVDYSFNLSLSILWGLISLSAVYLGIKIKKKNIRIASISLFFITLAKLFFFDISSLDTISKTILFVSLGALLLFISFLYNKFKSKIFDEDESK